MRAFRYSLRGQSVYAVALCICALYFDRALQTGPELATGLPACQRGRSGCGWSELAPDIVPALLAVERVWGSVTPCEAPSCLSRGLVYPVTESFMSDMSLIWKSATEISPCCHETRFHRSIF